MLEKVSLDICSHRIQDEINPFTSCELRGGNKITISGNKNNLINLMLISERRDIDADFHVYALLPRVKLKIVYCQAVQCSFVVQ